MDSESSTSVRVSLWRRMARLLHPSREHSVASAAALLMAATMLARVVGYLRDAYVAYAFGAGPLTDAYIAAFTLPDFLFYLAAGGSISISFISIFTRYITENREQEARKAFSIVVSVLVAGFSVLIAAGEVATPYFVRWWFPGFDAEQAALCTRLTRILLPAQMFFLVGGVVSAVLQTRRRFLVPALAPILYTAFIIAGGVLLSHRIGIAALAIGAVAGSFTGPFLLNAVGARRTGIGFRFSLDARHPAFREWLWMSLPLMLGVSVVAADDWIMRFFASGGAGEITRLNYAKRLLQVPIGVLGQAVGVASLPFFARLFSERRMEDFARSVNVSVSRLGAVSMLATAWMAAAAPPLVDLAFRRGRFSAGDARETAIYFAWFSLALIFWSVQGLYARAFYAARDMVRPMAAGTLVTVVSLAIYWAMFHRFSVTGLAVASNLAILLHTAVLAVMLNQRKLVPLSGLEWTELGKALLTSVFAGVTAVAVGRTIGQSGGRGAGLLMLALVSITWAGASAAGLWLTRSKLPRWMIRG